MSVVSDEPTLGVFLTMTQDQARKGIVSRGVLLDWKAYAIKHNITHSAFDSHAVTLHDLLEIAKDEDVTFREGDILVLRTGWTEEFNKLSEADQVGIAQRSDRRQIGVEPSQELLRWHWDTGIAMVATDTVAYELTPFIRPWGYSCHEVSAPVSAVVVIIVRSIDFESL